MRLLVLIAFLCFPLAACQEKEHKALSTNELIITNMQGQAHRFDVEVAVTLEDQARGLMHRTSLAEDAGMLFYFNNDAERGFWMKNTLIPLDLIFIKADGVIHHIHENAVPHDLTSIRSNGPVRAVLEINGGLSKKLGLQSGNKVLHPFFSENNTQ